MGSWVLTRGSQRLMMGSRTSATSQGCLHCSHMSAMGRQASTVSSQLSALSSCKAGLNSHCFALHRQMLQEGSQMLTIFGQLNLSPSQGHCRHRFQPTCRCWIVSMTISISRCKVNSTFLLSLLSAAVWTHMLTPSKLACLPCSSLKGSQRMSQQLCSHN